MSLRIGQGGAKANGNGGGLSIFKSVGDLNTVTPSDKSFLAGEFLKGTIPLVRRTGDNTYWQWVDPGTGYAWKEFTGVVTGPTGPQGVQGPKGTDGQDGTVDLSQVDGNEILYKDPNTQELKGSGVYVNGDKLTTRKILQAKELEVDPGTVRIGSTRLSETGSFLENIPDSTGKHYLFLDYENDPIEGTNKPEWWKRDRLERRVVRVTNPELYTQDIVGKTTIDFGHPVDNSEVSGIHIQFVRPVVNLKIRVLVNGNPVAWYPSKFAWENAGAAGLAMGSGERTIPLDPHLSLLTQYSVVAELKADNTITLKGYNDKPWYAIDRKKITYHTVVVDSDLANIVTSAQYDDVSHQLLLKGKDGATISSVPLINGLTTEELQDQVALMFVTGNQHQGISFSYDDVNGKINGIVTGGGGTSASDSNTDVVYVDLEYRGTVEIGTLLHPFKSIAHAITYAASNSRKMVSVAGKGTVSDLTFTKDLSVYAPGVIISGELQASPGITAVKIVCETHTGTNSASAVIDVFQFFRYAPPVQTESIYFGFGGPAPISATDALALAGNRDVSRVTGLYSLSRSEASEKYMHIVYPKSFGLHNSVRVQNSLWSTWTPQEIIISGKAYYDLASPFGTHSTDVVLEVK